MGLKRRAEGVDPPQVPDSDRAVFATSDDPLALGVEGYGGNVASVTLENNNLVKGSLLSSVSLTFSACFDAKLGLIGFGGIIL